MAKTQKGNVAIQCYKNRLRLVWSYGGKRYFFYIGLPVSSVNRLVAEQRARQIELDMAVGHFDPTLEKYRSPDQSPHSSLTAADVMEKFTAHRDRRLSRLTRSKYHAATGHLKIYFGSKLARVITPEMAEDFIHHLHQTLQPVTVRDRLILIRAAWHWAVKKKWLTVNPWVDIQVKIPPRARPNPFTRKEISSIMQAFRSDPDYSHYADFVEFLFSTGCRTGEAIGLRWKHLKNDCSSVWIGEAFTRGTQKATKTNRDRTIGMTSKLQAMLLARRPETPDSESFVFPSPGGKAIDDNNFRRRAWKSILERSGVEYRSVYNTRHTFISHCLEMGKSPTEIAYLVGNSPKVIFDHYAGVINRPTLPELL